ncbi:kelch-like protein 12 isoform X1 [Xenia sp. Carnegie-2017]|uniref:kelch-like protein 12 isoform X1 n=1 Tax=Xenia sp. Carnegie-2017 TaxID=2897299 RepID=UPI001F039CDA|nr:kelch-like protein 12 isoform X1 [Xenia sp. Carnegie-2017]
MCSRKYLSCKLYDNICRMWEARQLCDVEIVGRDGNSIEAHRLILSAISPYFRGMFTADLWESTQKVVKLESIDGDTIASLVRFAYSSKLDVSSSNVECLLTASSLLQIKEVEKICCDYLQEQLHTSNCLGIWALAEHQNCRELAAFSFKFILKNFPSIYQDDEFPCLSLNQVKTILGDPNLSINSEEEVFEACLRWIGSTGTREVCLPDLLDCVFLGSLTADYLRNSVLKNKLICNNLVCSEKAQKALRFSFAPLSEKQKSSFVLQNSTRVADGYGDQLLTIGGLNGTNAVNAVELYNMYTDSWESAADMPCERYGIGVAKLRGIIYCLGGYTSGVFLDICECYNTEMNIWQSMCRMLRPRKYLAASQSHNRIFAIGGTDGIVRQKSVESFDPCKNEWSCCAPMATPRMYLGTASIGGLIYAVGGHDGVRRLESVECYDASKDCWVPVRSMGNERSVAGVTTMDSVLYFAGGFDGVKHCKDACMYDPRENKWTAIADMNVPRSALCLVAMKSRLYALGGFNGQFLQSVETYDARANIWEPAVDMIISRAHFGASVF